MVDFRGNNCAKDTHFSQARNCVSLTKVSRVYSLKLKYLCFENKCFWTILQIVVLQTLRN